jgi:hypothetical protein
MPELWKEIRKIALFQIGLGCPGPYQAICSDFFYGTKNCGGFGLNSWYGYDPTGTYSGGGLCAICSNNGSCPYCVSASFVIWAYCYGYYYQTGGGSVCCYVTCMQPCLPSCGCN